MILDNAGVVFHDAGKTFSVGGGVYANGKSEYEGLFGTVTEIRTETDKETENDNPDIYCCFEIPEAPEMVAELEDRFSELYGFPKRLEEISLDFAIMAPDMLEPLPDISPAEDSRMYALTYHRDAEDSCAVGTLAVSHDMGALIRRMLEDVEEMDAYGSEIVLSHAKQNDDGCCFIYEAKDLFYELSLSYTISEIPILSQVQPERDYLSETERDEKRAQRQALKKFCYGNPARLSDAVLPAEFRGHYG